MGQTGVHCRPVFRNTYAASEIVASVEIGKDELTIIPKDGSAASHVVYTVFWFLRKADNQWKITRQIWNEKPAED